MRNTTNKSSEVKVQKKVYKSPVTIEHGKVIDKTQTGGGNANLSDGDSGSS